MSDEIAEKIKPLGADVVINSSVQDVAEILKQEEADGRPVSMSMDCLCGETLGKSLPYMAEGGYWVVISTLAGTETSIQLRPLLTKGLHLVGSMLRKRSTEEKTTLLSEITQNVWPKIESGKIKPSIYKTLPLEKANEALAILEKGENIGGLQSEPTRFKATGTKIRWKPDLDVFTDIDIPDDYFLNVLKKNA